MFLSLATHKQGYKQHTPWSLKYIWIHAWGLNTPTLCYRVCLSLQIKHVTKQSKSKPFFLFVWLSLLLAMGFLKSIAQVKNISATNDRQRIQLKAKDLRKPIILNREWSMFVNAQWCVCVNNFSVYHIILQGNRQSNFTAGAWPKKWNHTATS